MEQCKVPADLETIKTRLESLFVFLCSPEGRTDEMCKYVDNYFCLKEDWPDCIEHLPNELYDILFDTGCTLHDAVKDPDIAENFESLPEQLLKRIKEFNPND